MLLPDPQQPEHLIPSTHSTTEASVQLAGSEREAVAWAIMLESSKDLLWTETAENYTSCIRAVDVENASDNRGRVTADRTTESSRAYRCQRRLLRLRYLRCY